jgi:small subunit ribosomal protein S6
MDKIQEYEIAVVYHPSLEVDLEKAEARVKKIFSDNKGKVTNTDNWGKKKLAYPIAKNDHGIYVFYTVELPGEALSKVEGLLNITDEVIRYLIVRIDPKEVAKAEAAKQAQKEKLEKDQKRREDRENEDSTKDEAKE